MPMIACIDYDNKNLTEFFQCCASYSAKSTPRQGHAPRGVTLQQQLDTWLGSSIYVRAATQGGENSA